MLKDDIQKPHNSAYFTPRAAFIILCFINLCWGASYSVTKFALDVIPPTTLAFMRFLVGGAFLLFIPIDRSARITNKNLKGLFIVGAFGVAIAYAMQNLGLQMTSSTKTAVAASMEPVFTILLASFFLKEVVHKRTLMAMAISVSGALFMMLGGKTFLELKAEFFSSGELQGDILVMISILLCALYSILMKPLAKDIGAIRATSYGFFFGALLLLPIVAGELSQLWPIEFTFQSLVAIIFLGVVCNAIAFALWNTILKYTDAGAMAVTLNAQPIGGILLGWIWLGEKLSYTGILGTVLILVGVWILPKEAFK